MLLLQLNLVERLVIKRLSWRLRGGLGLDLDVHFLLSHGGSIFGRLCMRTLVGGTGIERDMLFL